MVPAAPIGERSICHSSTCVRPRAATAPSPSISHGWSDRHWPGVCAQSVGCPSARVVPMAAWAARASAQEKASAWTCPSLNSAAGPVVQRVGLDAGSSARRPSSTARGRLARATFHVAASGAPSQVNVIWQPAQYPSPSRCAGDSGVVVDATRVEHSTHDGRLVLDVANAYLRRANQPAGELLHDISWSYSKLGAQPGLGLLCWRCYGLIDSEPRSATITPISVSATVLFRSWHI
jgi:hypothetical protein